MGDNLTLKNEDHLGVVIENWHLCFHMAHAALKSHTGCLMPVSILLKIAGSDSILPAGAVRLLFAQGLVYVKKLYLWICATGVNFLTCNDLF